MNRLQSCHRPMEHPRVTALLVFVGGIGNGILCSRGYRCSPFCRCVNSHLMFLKGE